MSGFEAAWREAEPDVARYCRRYADRHGESDELLQRVRVSAERGHPGFRGDAPFKAWVLGIARREAIHLARIRRKWERGIEAAGMLAQHVASPVEGGFDPIGHGQRDQRKLVRLILSHALTAGALKPRDAAVLMARFNTDENFGWEAIAARLGITQNHAAAIHMRATAKLLVHVFVALPDVLGGVDAIRRAYTACLAQCRTKDSQVLTTGEAQAFEEAVLSAKLPSPTTARLLSACRKVIKFMPSPF